ncbi:rich repeat and nacht domain-containing protein [Anaeramoeba flamelloides]|uniref:Rich repeat and nacht domain-containing protein n=1 Tax=Anaeramoeba flamelloides TaxID=1746091 RepID=A0AAV7ZWT4_9EUKA|nr:rich repeat and nacht domain-containing protein [Anaeramoeba flamelloides]
MSSFTDLITQEDRQKLSTEFLDTVILLASNNSILEEIDLYEQKIQPREWELFCLMLGFNESVRELKLMIRRDYATNPTYLDFGKMGEALKANRGLKLLKLTCGVLNATIVEGLRSVIKNCKAKIHLSLTMMSVDANVLNQLFEALMDNENVEEFALFNTPLNGQQYALFNNFVKTSACIKKLMLEPAGAFSSMNPQIPNNSFTEMMEVVKAKQLTHFNLLRVVFEDRQITELVTAFEDNPHLEILSLSNDNLNDNQIQAIVNSKMALRLKTLKIGQSRGTSISSKHVEGFLTKTTHLEELNIAGGSWKAAGQQSILMGISQNKSLRKINLSGYDFCDSKSLSELSKLMDSEKHPKIEHLKLNLCRFSSKSKFLSFLKCFKKNTTLKKLRLNSTLKNLKNARKDIMNDILDYIPNLESLDLSSNLLTDEYFTKFLQKLISKKHSLKELNIERNEFGDRTAIDMGKLLKLKECKLEKLAISSNVVGFSAIKQIILGAKENNTLVELTGRWSLDHGTITANKNRDHNWALFYWETVNAILKSKWNCQQIKFSVGGFNGDSWSSLFLMARNKKFNSNSIYFDMINLQKKEHFTDSKISDFNVHKLWIQICNPKNGFEKAKQIIEKINDQELIKKIILFFYSGAVSDQIKDILTNDLSLEIVNNNKTIKNDGFIKNNLLMAYKDNSSKNFKITCSYGGEIKIHKFLLVARSELFRNMFLNLEEECFQVKDFTEKHLCSLQALTEFFYTDKINPENYNNEQLLLIIDELKDATNYYQLNKFSNLNSELQKIHLLLEKN